MLIAALSDKVRHRFLFTLIPLFIGISGFAVLMKVHHNHHTEYGALFLITMGVYSAMPIGVCHFQMNLGGHHRRAVGSAWQISFGNIFGILSSFIFPATDAKKFFHKGYSICLGFLCFAAANCIAYFIACHTQNKTREKRGGDVGLTEYERTELGDMSPDYRYML